MHCPGQFIDLDITATGVTPDIVLPAFFMYDFSSGLIMATNREGFNQIADSWYRLRHWSRFDGELKQMASRWSGGKLLNIGCAHGPDFLPFHGSFELWGIDYSEKMIMLAGKYAEKFKLDVNLVIGDAVHLPFPTGYFDYATAVAVYHHVDDKKNRALAFKELHRVLRPNGEAFITVWNRWQPSFFFKGKEVMVPWKQKNTVLLRYHYLYTYRELGKTLKEMGFDVLSIRPEAAFRWPIRQFSRNICALVRAA